MSKCPRFLKHARASLVGDRLCVVGHVDSMFLFFMFVRFSVYHIATFQVDTQPRAKGKAKAQSKAKAAPKAYGLQLVLAMKKEEGKKAGAGLLSCRACQIMATAA